MLKIFDCHNFYFQELCLILHLLLHRLPYDALKKKKVPKGSPWVAQRLGICLPMQGTWVLSLVQEDPTCHGATKPGVTTSEPMC